MIKGGGGWEGKATNGTNCMLWRGRRKSQAIVLVGTKKRHNKRWRNGDCWRGNGISSPMQASWRVPLLFLKYNDYQINCFFLLSHPLTVFAYMGKWKIPLTNTMDLKNKMLRMPGSCNIRPFSETGLISTCPLKGKTNGSLDTLHTSSEY